jgi:hypothetical protein
VGFMLGNRVLFRKAFEVLEPCASRDARTVLRGGSGGNAASLPDVRPERIVDGVLRKVGLVVFRCPYPGVHRW